MEPRKKTFKNSLASAVLVMLFWLPAAETFSQDSSVKLLGQSQETAAQKLPLNNPEPGMECAGKLQPRQRFSLILEPGERVLLLDVSQGMTVEKGALLARLANDGLHERLTALEDKRLTIIQDRDRMQLIAIRAENARFAIQRLEKRIDEEKRILKKVPDYPAEVVLRDLVETKTKQEEELRVYMRELTLAGKRDLWLVKMEAGLEAMAAAIHAQIERLAIHAPFAGRVIYAAQEIRGQIPGCRVLEIWDDEILQVNAVVFQHQLPLIKPGSSARIFPHFFQNQSFQGRVRSIGASPISETADEFPKFPITIDMDRHVPALVTGMGVTVRIFGPETTEKQQQ